MDPGKDDRLEPDPTPAPLGLEAAEDMWRSVHAEFGLLTSQEVSQLLGLPDPDDVRSIYAEGRLVAIHRGGRVLYPGFQIDRETRTVLPVMHDLLRAAEETGRTESSLISWLLIPASSLGGVRPVDVLDDPERIVAAARKSLITPP